MREFTFLRPVKYLLNLIPGKMDRNGDGSVDKKELFSWILRSFKSLSQEESADRFQDTDDDQVRLSWSWVWACFL